MTPKERMLNAYCGRPSDRPAVAPELWTYYPAKLLGVDMIAFEREVPFHQALMQAFAHFDCEGWGIVFGGGGAAPDVETRSEERWIDDDTLEVSSRTRTPAGAFTRRQRFHRDEPSWPVERPIKDFVRDLPAWEAATFGGAPEGLDPDPIRAAWEEVGERYLLEGWLGVPFFDTVGGAFDGGLEAAVVALFEHEAEWERLRERTTDHLVRRARTLCERTPLESFCIGCSWSCNSLLGPDLWRRWDKPGIRAVAEELHRHGRLLHVHFHGR
ncbi:MAG: hypothetical protein ACOCX4_04205, partial [Planctomycetota bacterium]